MGCRVGRGRWGLPASLRGARRIPRGCRSAPHASADPSKPFPLRQCYCNWNNKGAHQCLRRESGAVGAGIGIRVSPALLQSEGPPQSQPASSSGLCLLSFGWDAADVLGVLAEAEQMSRGSVAAHPRGRSSPRAGSAQDTAPSLGRWREGGREGQNPHQTDHRQLQTKWFRPV